MIRVLVKAQGVIYIRMSAKDRLGLCLLSLLSFPSLRRLTNGWSSISSVKFLLEADEATEEKYLYCSKFRLFQRFLFTPEGVILRGMSHEVGSRDVSVGSIHAQIRREGVFGGRIIV